jgi:predicted DNA-binding transcriptional regulator AlpA
MTHQNTPNRPGSLDSSERILPRRELRTLVPVSDMTIWRWERDRQFPRHLSINGRNYWLRSEVHGWMAAQKRGAVATENDR